MLVYPLVVYFDLLEVRLIINEDFHFLLSTVFGERLFIHRYICLFSLRIFISGVSAVFAVNLLTILSTEKSFSVSRGEALSLKCSFQADTYNLFDYPVLWRKTQLHEEVQVNIMGNVNEPFMNRNRFEVSFVSEPPRYHLELTITGKTTDDSTLFLFGGNKCVCSVRSICRQSCII